MNGPAVPGAEGTARRGRGRPATTPDAAASAVTALGARLREMRQRQSLTLMRLGGLTGYSWQHLGAVERGQVAPSEAVVEACDAALAANGELVALLPAVVREQARIRHQRLTARRSGQAGEGTPACISDDLDVERLARSARHPSQLTPSLVEDLELITDRQRRLYHVLSSAEMILQVRAHLGLLTSLLEGSAPQRLRRRVASAAAEAAGLAAWLAFDLGDSPLSDELYRQADVAAKDADDPGLGCYIRVYRGAAAGHQRGFSAELAQLAATCDQAPRSLSLITRSWLEARTAVALAQCGDRLAAHERMTRARDHLDRAEADGAEAWMYEFDHGCLAAAEGRCHLALDDSRRAAAAFVEALQLLPDTCCKRGAETRVGLARAQLRAGEVEEALRLGSAALVIFADRGSAPGLRQVRDLAAAMRHAGHPGAGRALEEQARSLLCR